MSKAKEEKTLAEVIEECDSCDLLVQCESEQWDKCPYDEPIKIKEEYTSSEIKQMVETVFGWFLMHRSKHTRDQIEEMRGEVEGYLRELADLVGGDCMPIAWEGEYYEDGYTEQDVIDRQEEVIDLEEEEEDGANNEIN